MTPPAPTGRPAGPPRLLLGFAMTGAWLVTAVFVLIGDGVEPSGTGLGRLLLEYAHQGAWLLLALALTWAVIKRSWSRASSALAVGALVLYIAFVLALLGAGGE